jgi:FkbM family methyltransferase
LREAFIPFNKASYSDRGEDLIVAGIFDQIGITRPFYIDIGANDPIYRNNTYHFYRRGSRGVLVEPNPMLADKLARKRPGDICLAQGVGKPSDSPLTFYVFDNSALSTFSLEQARHVEKSSEYRVVSELKVPIVGINEIFEKYGGNGLHYISVDCEGLDLDILKSIHFDRFRPALFCVETTLPQPQGAGRNFMGAKIPEILDTMAAQGYWAIADSSINTIFVDSKVLSPWKSERM